MPNQPRNPKPGKNRVFTVNCVLNNVIYLTEKTWQQHSIPRHAEQELVGDLEHVKATLTKASRLRRSTDPHHGPDTCVYERFVENTNLLMRVPVLFPEPTYEDGNLLGYVMTIMTLPEPQWNSGQVGEIFWAADEVEKDEK